MVSRLQAKASQIGNILTSLEKKYDMSKLEEQESKGSSSSHAKKSNKDGPQSSGGPPIKKPHLKFQIPPYNPKNVNNKSPIIE